MFNPCYSLSDVAASGGEFFYLIYAYMPMCKFWDIVKITKIFLYIVYIDKSEQTFYNMLKEFRFGLAEKGVIV